MKEFVMENGPYIKVDQDNKKISLNIFLVLLVFAIFAIIKNGLMPFLAHKVEFSGFLFPVLFILTALITGLLIDLLCREFTKTNDNGNYYDSLNISLLLACILPMNISLIYVCLGVAISIIFKYVMNYFFKNPILVPVLIGWGAIMGAYVFNLIPSIDYLNPLEVDLGTPLANPEAATYNNFVAPYGSLLDFFLGLVPGGIGSTSVLLSLVAYIYLSFKQIIKWRIPLVTIATIFIITYMIGGFGGLEGWYPIFQICSGSLVFGTVFLATNSKTSPVTPIGQILYGLFLGILVIVLRYFTPLTDGSLVAILIMPIFKSFFDYIGSSARFNFNKAIIAFVIAWILIITMGCYIGIKEYHSNVFSYNIGYQLH